MGPSNQLPDWAQEMAGHVQEGDTALAFDCDAWLRRVRRVLEEQPQPDRVGERAARTVDQIALLLIYAVILYLVFVARYFTPVMLIVFFAFKHALSSIRLLSKPRPTSPPEGYPAWPTWFSASTFFHNRQFGGLLIVGLVTDAILHVVPFTHDLILRYWPPM